MPTNSPDQRDKLMTIARTLFATKGYEATTTRKINTLAHTSDGLLYYYFPGGKKALLDAILLAARDSRTESLHSFQFEAAKDAASVHSEILRFFQFIWATLNEEENYQVFQITVREKNLLSAAQLDWIRRLNLLISEELRDFLTASQNHLAVSPEEIPVLSQTLIATFQAVIFTQLVVTEEREITPDHWQGLKDSVSLSLRQL
ncbi:helix-turn-helix domain-containing protein [Lacticaseibacillus brantae]|uniref:HTH tetR-type domain-containing protein n=1 Tax=Lacticaseibacillus brantae DSM 23927 TaxID=1423727 RepID=A0A0R2B1Q0_9LACO|nr:TetR/AcrR family transcriptional regulator [Lacticaseibacillus brantae]KRM71892.1 hypothetical protein FC34_GL000868 [Lacticaseibacillus brantae DSM 23927]